MTRRARPTRLTAVLLVLACAAAGSALLLASPVESEAARASVPAITATATTDVSVGVKAPATVSLTSSTASTVQWGMPSTFTADVRPAPATGTVTFYYLPDTGGGPVALGDGPVALADDTASLTIAIPAFRVNSVTAVYSGDTTHTVGTSGSLSVEVIGYAGQVIVTEFRESGPLGPADSYLELFNTGAAVPLAYWTVVSQSGITVSVPADAGTLDHGRSYLITGADYGLGQIAASDYTVPSIGTGGFSVNSTDSIGRQTDAVGPESGYHLGGGIPAMTSPTIDQHAWVRTETAGVAQNTNDNAADFRLVSDDGETVGGLPSTLGSASPTGATSSYQHNEVLQSDLIDVNAGQADPPNRKYTAGTPGELLIRRTILNTSGLALDLVKLRVTALSEANGAPQPGVSSQPATHANLRVVDAIPTASRGRTPLMKLSVDDPTGLLGGGLNSTLSVELPTVWLPGRSISIEVRFAVDTPGTFWFGYDVDATDVSDLRAGGTVRPYSAPAGRGGAVAAGNVVQGVL